MYFPKEKRSAYRSWDNDACMGKTAPSIRELKYLQGSAPAEGQVTVVFFWGKFHKAGYKYNPLMTALDAKYPDAKVVGVAVDVEEKDTQTFLDDPKAKYALVPLFSLLSLCSFPFTTLFLPPPLTLPA